MCDSVPVVWIELLQFSCYFCITLDFLTHQLSGDINIWKMFAQKVSLGARSVWERLGSTMAYSLFSLLRIANLRRTDGQ